MLTCEEIGSKPDREAAGTILPLMCSRRNRTRGCSSATHFRNGCSKCSSASNARATARTRGQPAGASGTGSGRKLWQPAEPTDDGRCTRCSPTHCRWFPLESHRSEKWLAVLCHREMGECASSRNRMEARLGKKSLSALPHDKKPARNGVGEG